MKKLILFVLALIPTVSFGQQLQNPKRMFLPLDRKLADKYQLDFDGILNSVPLDARNKLYVELNERQELVDLSIFDEKVFSESRLDWRQ